MMINTMNTIDPIIRKYMEGGEEWKKGYLEGKKAAANYSSPFISSMGRVLTPREMKGFVYLDGMELDLYRYFSVVEGVSCPDSPLKEKLARFCDCFSDQLYFKLKERVKIETTLRKGTKIHFNKKIIKVAGSGRIFAQPEERQELWTRVFPLPEREVAVYQTINCMMDVLGAGYICEDTDVLRIYRVK